MTSTKAAPAATDKPKAHAIAIKNQRNQGDRLDGGAEPVMLEVWDLDGDGIKLGMEMTRHYKNGDSTMYWSGEATHWGSCKEECLKGSG